MTTGNIPLILITMKRKKKSRLLAIIAIVSIVGLGVLSFLQYSQNQDLKQANQMYEQELANNQQTVYVAIDMINAGEIITDSGEDANVQRQVVYTGLESFNYITAEDMGKRALINIAGGNPVMYNMITDVVVNNDTREYEIATANLTTDQNENDFVDVRISFPNGEDYIVLSKKQVTKLNLESCVFTSLLNEEEILRYTSAIVDAYTITGTRIYTARYVEETIQEDAIPTYPVRETTIDLINSDPNVVTKATETLNYQARVSLQDRLGNLTEDELDAVNAGYGLTDTAQSAVLGGRVNESTSGTQINNSESLDNSYAQPVQPDVNGVEAEESNDNEMISE